MNTLRQALDEYLSLRRHLGFKLREAGKALLDFVAFMEQQEAPVVSSHADSASESRSIPRGVAADFPD
jgi:hypothetical protein